VGGAVPLGIDTFELPVNQSALNGGWTPKGKVTGISLMHESGTGGGPKYGFPAQMPLTTIEAPVNLLDNVTYWQDRVCGKHRQSTNGMLTAERSATIPPV
jgi:hypothetical protein